MRGEYRDDTTSRPPPVFPVVGDTSSVLLTMLCLVASLEGADLMLLGATFHAIERDLGILPVHLASLAMAQALMQACACPIWGLLADHQFMQRKTILAVGCAGWGLVTVGLGRARDLESMITLRGMNGLLLGTMSPMVQSIVADVIAPEQRGRAFGCVCCSVSFGAVCTSLLVTPLSHRVVFGESGWRYAFFLIGVMSICVASMVMMTVVEPVRKLSPNRSPFDKGQPRFSVGTELSRVASYFRIPTFLVLCGQGMFGAIPWNALSFTTLFYQLSGFSDIEAATLASLGIMSGGAGQLLGGHIGDYMERRFPLHGRPLTAQISVLCGIPLVYVIFCGFPTEPEYFWMRAVLVCCFSVTATWCCTGVNRPILSEIVDQQDRSSIFAWMLALEGSVGALLGAPLVAFLAQRGFGFHVQPTQKVHGPDSDQAAAIGLALAWVCSGFWTVCLLLYSFLHCSYRRDVLRARADHEEESKARLIPKVYVANRDVRA